VTTARGDSLILYTDGLVERRGEVIDAGLDRLLAALIRCRDEPPPRLLEIVTGELRAELPDNDDICALCLRFETG
jgi:serine phosphatase RsbU (regulator of sigma subunit)